MSSQRDVPTPAAATAVPDPEAVLGRYEHVRSRIAAAAERVGRSASTVTLVAVSKGFGPEAVEGLRAAGHADFGESRAQDLERKARALGQGLRWHFVGSLQRNKVKDVVDTASLIHSVDRLELAQAIAERARRSGRLQRVLVQVNVGRDPAKAGCALEEAPSLVARVRGLDWIACEGLMTIPPFEADARALFETLRVLRDDIRERFPEVQHLSMGMSGDFEEAVEEGATIVRIGEAVFGPRPERH